MHPVYFTVAADQSGRAGDQNNAGTNHRYAKHSHQGDMLTEEGEAKDGRKYETNGHQRVGGTHFHLG